MEHHDVPEADVAAALAVVAQGETPLLLSPTATGRSASRTTTASAPPGRPGPAGRPRDRAGTRTLRSRGSGPRAMYRIEVGRRHRVEPRQVVGALANEGGLSRDDFGRIEIRADFSLVELPADLSPDVLERLRGTRISGKLIELRPDTGGRPRRS